MKASVLVAAAVLFCALAVCGCAGDGASSASSASRASEGDDAVEVARSYPVEEAIHEAAVQRVVEEVRTAKERAEQKRAEKERLEQERAEQERLEQERLEWEQAQQELAITRDDDYLSGDYSDTVLIGDSIMQNAQLVLLDTLPGVTVNADAGRTLETGGLVFENASPDLGVLDHVRNDEGAYARYVIGTGNNDYAGMPMDAAEEIVSCLGSGKEIFFITEMVVGNAYGTDVTNETIAALVEKYPNVHAIDWHDLVVGHEDEYLSDGCHVRSDRMIDYAALIKACLDGQK